MFHGQAIPCYTHADPFATMNVFQFLFAATDVTIKSRIWCWSLLGIPSVFLLMTAIFGSLYTSRSVSYSLLVCGILAEIWSCLNECHGDSLSARHWTGMASHAVVYQIWTVLRICYWPADVAWAVSCFDRKRWPIYSSTFLMTDNCARQNTWKRLTELCGSYSLCPTDTHFPTWKQ